MDKELFNLYKGIYYDPKSPVNLKDFRNRQLFLQAAAEHVPDFAASLFVMTWTKIGEWTSVNGEVPKPITPAAAQFNSLIFSAIQTWAHKFNIEVEWVMEEAWGIIALGQRYAQVDIDPLKAFGAWRRTHTGKDTRQFQLPAWQPLEESEPSYVARADRAWKKARREHVASKKSELASKGLKPLPTPRTRRLSSELRLQWAVLHQCAGRSIEELASEYCEDTEAVRTSVARILRDLGFTPPT